MASTDSKSTDTATPLPGQETGARWLWGLRVSALIEIGLFFAAAIAIDLLFFGGHRFTEVRPHPFWFIVVLVSVQYGANEGLLAAIAASVVLLFDNLPPQSFGQDVYDYWIGVGLRPALWVGIAQALGQLRGRQIRERDILRARLHNVQKQAEVITASFDELKRAKAALEARIARQFRTVITTYRAAQAMDAVDEGRLASGIDDLILAILSPRKFSLWTLTPSGFVLTRAHGWADDEQRAKTLSLDHTLVRHILGRGSTLNVARRDDERVLQGEGLLAGALTDVDTGEVVGMLKIEDTAFVDFNLYTLENFGVVCSWVGTALIRSRRWRELQRDRVSGGNAFLMSEEVLDRMIGLLSTLGKRQGFTSSVMVIDTIAAEVSDAPEVRTAVALAVGEAIRASFRSSDLAFESQRHDGRFVMLLPATAVEQAKAIIDKVERAIRQRLPKGQSERKLSIKAIDITEMAKPTAESRSG
ncbi:hypothetical protein [Thalassobaculum sp.]|uniref:hypothetical protein n=1 Tax=Thalassobaculum sp. TaxID=2022740 RepID=UPI0032ED5F29